MQCRFLPFISSAILPGLLLLAACGDSSQAKKHKIKKQDELTAAGKYVVNLAPLNTSVGGFSVGKAKIHIVADKISVSVAMKETPSQSVHAQHIYTASECPKERHDLNADGFIDPVEASKVLGKILVPLDGDLNSQLQGIDAFPLANALGQYEYYQEASWSKLVSDLQAPDINLKDELGKIVSGQDLLIEGRVLVIQGISDDIYLPGSIQGLINVSEKSSLSIACGKIERAKLAESEIGEPEEN